MYHYVLFKLAPDFSTEAMEELFETIYARLPAAVSEIDTVSFIKSCSFLHRDSDMDVAIEVKLNDWKGLKKYLDHPIHKSFIEKTCDHVVERVTFDCEENRV
ncbi:MAG: Dabb family protein [Emergencia sp.]